MKLTQHNCQSSVQDNAFSCHPTYRHVTSATRTLIGYLRRCHVMTGDCLETMISTVECLKTTMATVECLETIVVCLTVALMSVSIANIK